MCLNLSIHRSCDRFIITLILSRDEKLKKRKTKHTKQKGKEGKKEMDTDSSSSTAIIATEMQKSE